MQNGRGFTLHGLPAIPIAPLQLKAIKESSAAK